MKKNLVFILKASQDYVRYNGQDAEKNVAQLNELFESISDLYIPLLNMLHGFESESLPIKFGLVLPPVLCTLLSKEEIQEQYIQWLEKRIIFGNEQLESTDAKENEAIIRNVKEALDKNIKLKVDFEEKYQKNLVKAFADFQQKGYIELLATTGTDIFMLHYSDMPEVVSAQVETGLLAYRNFFGDFPYGFWLPDLAYFNGVEKIIKAYGYSYTILDSRSVLLTDAPSTKGIFYPARTDNSLEIFATNPELNDILFGENGYSTNELYRNENQDLGFELPMEQLSSIMNPDSVRFSTGYKCWNKVSTSSADNNIKYYDSKAALAQVKKDAEDFLVQKSEYLKKAEALLPESDYVLSICSLELTKIKKNWHEAITWIEEILRRAEEYNLSLTTCKQLQEKQSSLEKITPYCSSSLGNGYGENLLSSKNCWMMRYVHKASERMTDLADRFPNDTGLKTRLLNLGAKELMIAQSSGLAKMIEDEEYPEYAEQRFTESIASFTAVFDSLGSNIVSTEWLTSLELKDDLFPWMNYRIFSKKQ
ncbi:MAG: DUF1957 domain-containing protein [Treponema sp.]|nr:DUF1957 domain-containing protein [Treponema sp.]